MYKCWSLLRYNKLQLPFFDAFLQFFDKKMRINLHNWKCLR